MGRGCSMMKTPTSRLARPGLPFASCVGRLPGGSSETVLEEPADASWAIWCPTKPGTSCALSQQDGTNLAFYSLDPVRGKGERLGKIEVTGFSYWNISAEGSRIACLI